MKLRTLFLAVVAMCLCALVVTPSSRAQAPPQAQKLQALAKQLNLTPMQKAKLMPILEAEAPKMEAIKNNPSLGPFQKVEQIKALHAQTDPQVQAILTPAQFEQLQGIRQQEIKQAMEKKLATQQ